MGDQISVLNSRKINLFLFSQGVSGFGDAFHFIAVVTLLVSISGKGITAAFGIISYPFIGILFSIFGGSIGDRYNPKCIMVVIELLRAVITFCFILTKSIFMIYALIVILSILDTLYSPSKRKITVALIKNDNLLSFNLLLNGILGAAFVIGPVIAGIIVDSQGYAAAFSIKSLSCLFSALLLSFIKLKTEAFNKSTSTLFRDIKEGYEYCKRENPIKFLIFISVFVFAFFTCVNICFYPFAFDTLKITPKIWSFMMSVYYGAGFLTMLISGMIERKIMNNFISTLYICFLVLSVIWIAYGVTGKITVVFILQAAEGFTASLSLVIINTQIMRLSKKKFVARTTAVNDVFSNLGKLGGITCTYPMLRLISVRFIFFAASIGLISVASIMLIIWHFISNRGIPKRLV